MSKVVCAGQFIIDPSLNFNVEEYLMQQRFNLDFLWYAAL